MTFASGSTWNLRVTWRMLLVLLACQPCVFAAKPIRIYVEAEDCTGLERYPYDNEDVEGWYAHEANVRFYGAPGHSYCASINKSTPANKRSMSQKLSAPLPPGKYRVFLRTLGPMVSQKETIVRVSVGGAETEFRWGKGGKSFVWQPSGPNQNVISLTKSADTVVFTAVQFGGQGHGSIYEMIANAIWIDTLYITSDLSEKNPPIIEAEHVIRGGNDPGALGKRRAYRSDELGPSDYQTPAPERPAIAASIKLASFDGRRNLWPNSSFELGMNDGWTANNTGRGCFHVFTDADLDEDKPFHGSYSLRVPGKRQGFSIDPFSRAYQLETGGQFALSLYIRGKGGQVSVFLKRVQRKGTGNLYWTLKMQPLLSAKGTAGPAWSRIVAKGKLSPGHYALYLVSNKDFWVDAIQLERGGVPSAYAPRAELEGALRTGQLANILYDGQKKLTLWFHNSGKQKKKAKLAYRIVDVRERVIAEGVTSPMALKAGATAKIDLDILPPLRGLFSAVYAAEGRDLPEGETVYLVMPKPADKHTRHELGGNMTPGEGDLAVNARLGLKWVLTCKTQLFGQAAGEAYPGKRAGVHPSPGVFNFSDGDAKRIKKHGYHNLPCFWPRRVPKFMAEAPKGPIRTYRKGSRTLVPKLDEWQKHAGTVAAHYEPLIKKWCIDDEVEVEWHLSHLVPFTQATLEAVRKAAPTVDLGISAAPPALEELLVHLGENAFDFFGASTFDFQYWESRYVRHLKRRYDKPWVCYGVGARYPCRTMYHTLFNYTPVYPHAATMVRRIVTLALLQDLDVVGHYAAVIRNNGMHLGMNKPLCDYDGTPLPWGASFAIVGTLLADAEPVSEVPIGNGGRFAHVFRIGERIGAVTWSTCVREYDHNFRPTRRVLKDFSIACPEGSIEVLDMYWNPRTDVQRKDGRLIFDMTEEPVFLMDKTLGEERFAEMLRQSGSAPEPLEMVSMRLVPAKSDGIDVELSFRNNTDQDMKQVKVECRFSKRQPFSAAGAWLLKKPVATLQLLPAGKEAATRFSTVLDGRQPYEYGAMRVNARAATGIEGAGDQTLWLVPAFPVSRPPSIDGKLQEWESRPAAWLAYDWSWALMTRSLVQLYEGGEHFGYPPYRVDARAAFWTSYDEKNLYVALRLEDDMPILAEENGERIRLVFSVGQNNATVLITPLAGGKATAMLLAGNGRDKKTALTARSSVVKTKRLNGAMAKEEEISEVNIEVVIPWSELGIKPSATSMVGFDLFWTDADREGDTVAYGTLRWAGQAKEHGYMFLRGE